MSNSASVMRDYSSAAKSNPLILDSLPNPAISEQGCPWRTQQRLDLILLALEALELGGAEQMLVTAKELDLQSIIKNRVVLWRLRCTNPWRRSYARRPLNLAEAKALVAIAVYRSRKLTVLIRQLLLAEQQMKEKGLPLDHHFRLSEYLDRFRGYFHRRMNPRRAKVERYLSSPDKLNDLALELLSQLLFCTGTAGMQRFWISLFDGEV